MSPIRKLEVGPNMVVYYTDGPAGPGRPGTTLPGLPTGLEAAVRVLGLKMPSDPPSAPKLATPGMFSRTKEQAAQIELSPKGDLADPPYMPEPSDWPSTEDRLATFAMLVARADAARKDGFRPRGLMSAHCSFHHSTTPVGTLMPITLKAMVYSKTHEGSILLLRVISPIYRNQELVFVAEDTAGTSVTVHT